MPSSFVQQSVRDLIAKAQALGVEVPAAVHGIANGCGGGSAGARIYAALHPEQAEDDGTGVPAELLGCCYGAAFRGVGGCVCWEPVFDIEQAEPRIPTTMADIEIGAGLCGDCAYRKGSPERAEEYAEETLLSLPERGQPFWCHQGMRRPRVYRHPSGLEVPGDPADWQPAIVDVRELPIPFLAIPFRADGRPGILCGGWAKRLERAAARPS